MPNITTLGKELVNRQLPPAYRNPDIRLDGKAIEAILSDIGKKDSDQYKKTAFNLMRLGGDFSTYEGTTIGLSDVRPIMDIGPIADTVEAKAADIKNSQGTNEEKEQAISELYSGAKDMIANTVYEKALKMNNPLALQVLSKARGNKVQLAQILASPGAYHDTKGRLIPFFIRHSFSQGLSPAEYFASTYGTRRGVISTKFGTRRGGDLGKQLTTAAAGLIITSPDCGTQSALPVSVDDADNTGAFLARDTGGYPAGTAINEKISTDLKKNGYDNILIRSPITCGESQGICQVCAGYDESGKLYKLRDHIGITASNALAERVAQGALNVKHGGSKANTNRFSGFEGINQLVQIPSAFPNRAAVAETDGRVTDIKPAPQGGNYVVIDDNEHYVGAGEQIMVKKGDLMEAGDQLSSGLLNPSDIVKYKGLGEGRKYFTDRLTKMFKDSGLGVNRRNVEAVTRAMYNTVEVTDPEGSGNVLPGEITTYNELASAYKPGPGAKELPARDAKNQYLERPELHFTIGTRLTPSVIKTLDKYNIKNVVANKEKPLFKDRLFRLREIPIRTEKNWMSRLQGSYLKGKLEEDVRTGAESDIHETNPMPGLAYGLEFGKSRPDKITF